MENRLCAIYLFVYVNFFVKMETNIDKYKKIPLKTYIYLQKRILIGKYGQLQENTNTYEWVRIYSRTNAYNRKNCVYGSKYETYLYESKYANTKYAFKRFELCKPEFAHACLIHNAHLWKIPSFCKILDLKITHFKKNSDWYFCLISAIVIQGQHSKAKTITKLYVRIS